ncbi:hypothetical protein FRC00_011274 [Tulasnella sp. 408]|nr:hypothetical protein FRC00_011274 [Tulasnella sp. 408]
MHMSSQAPKQTASKRKMGADAASSQNEPPSDASTGLAPIDHISFDIFQVIITMCQKEQSSTRFTVTHVCRHWREYALAMPLLWNSLHINERVPCWEMLEAMLQRSGQAPLDIYIGQPPFVKSALPHLRKIMRMIIPHLERWRTLHLSEVPYKVRRILLDQITAKPAPRLEHFAVSQNPPWDRPTRFKLKNSCPNWRAKNIFAGSPNLTDVEWTNSTSDLNALPTFSNLLTLTIGYGTLSYISPRPFIQLIRQILLDSPSLEKLTIWNHPIHKWDKNDEREGRKLQLPALTHRSLQTLFIEGSDSIRSAAIRSLILPKLRALSTGYDVDRIDPSCCDIIAQENSLPELRLVSISGFLDREFKISEAFRPHMPFVRPAIQNLANLRVLTFQVIDFDDGRWLPDLDCIGFTIPSIRLLVETRIQRDGIHPLELLCIHPSYFAPPEYTVNEEEAAWFSKYLIFKHEYYGLDNEPDA